MMTNLTILGLEDMVVQMGNNKETISEDEYKEFLKFMEEYELEKKKRREGSLLMWIYNKFK